MQIADAHMTMIHATERLLALFADAVRNLDQRVSALEQHQQESSAVPEQPGGTVTYAARVRGQRILAELEQLTPWAAFQVLAWANEKTQQRASTRTQKEHTMSDSPTPDEDQPPADPVPEAATAIVAGTVAEPAADSDAVEIIHDVAPDAPR